MGLPEESIEVLRQVTPADVPETDLASIPAPMRWWINSYGAHTPAAIIHDRFIGSTLPAGVSEWQVDRYFRFMLADTGVRVIKRWIMWAAVALRTRWATKGAIRTALLVWFLVAISGTVMSIVALTQRDGAKLALYAVLLPLPAAGLWGRQAGAGLIAAYLIFPFIIVPMLASLVMLLPFWLGEIALSKFLEPAKAGPDQTADHRAAEGAHSVDAAVNGDGLTALGEGDGAGQIGVAGDVPQGRGASGPARWCCPRSLWLGR